MTYYVNIQSGTLYRRRKPTSKYEFTWGVKWNVFKGDPEPNLKRISLKKAKEHSPLAFKTTGE